MNDVFNETACSPGGVRQCGDYDADDCLTGGTHRVPADRVCEALRGDC